MRKVTLLLLLLVGWLQYSLWLSKNGIGDYLRLKKEVLSQQQINQEIKTRNDRLFAEINNLNSGLEAIEERARDELGMIKPGETYYRIVTESNKQPSPIQKTLQ